MVTVWVTVLGSVLGETLTVLDGAVVVVPGSVLGGGAVSVTVSGGAPPPPWCRGACAGVVTGAVVDGLCAGDPIASLTTAYTSAASSTNAMTPAAASVAGRRYQGGGGSGAGSYCAAGSEYALYRAAAVGSE
jgi:hypothetical protein